MARMANASMPHARFHLLDFRFGSVSSCDDGAATKSQLTSRVSNTSRCETPSFFLTQKKPSRPRRPWASRPDDLGVRRGAARRSNPQAPSWIFAARRFQGLSGRSARSSTRRATICGSECRATPSCGFRGEALSSRYASAPGRGYPARVPRVWSSTPPSGHVRY